MPEVISHLTVSSELDEKIMQEVAATAAAERPEDEEDVVAKNTKQSGTCPPCCRMVGDHDHH